MIWRDEDGEVRPSCTSSATRRTPENGYVSQMGFDIVRRWRARVIKNVVVETDADLRGKTKDRNSSSTSYPSSRHTSSPKRSSRPIKIGSYVWTKIADIDVELCASTFLNTPKTSSRKPPRTRSAKSPSS